MNSGLFDTTGKEIVLGDKIHYYTLEYWEQQSFPGYTDCSAYSLIEHYDTVVFKFGMFQFDSNTEPCPLIYDMPAYKQYDDITQNDDGDLMIGNVGVECTKEELKLLEIFEIVNR